MALQSEFTDYTKLALYAFIPALVVSLVLGMLSSIFTQFAWINFIILAVITMWAVAKIPKEITSFWGILILVLFLLGIQGLLGMILPSVTALQWASISSASGLLTTMVAGAFGVALVKKYV